MTPFKVVSMPSQVETARTRLAAIASASSRDCLIPQLFSANVKLPQWGLETRSRDNLMADDCGFVELHEAYIHAHRFRVEMNVLMQIKRN